MFRTKLLLHYLLYLIIATSTILLNKWLYINENVPIVTLTLMQFVSVFIGLQIFERFNIFCIKSIHLDVIFIPAVLFCSLVTFMNLSLALNSLATYQISKTIVTPIIILIQLILYKKKCSILVYTTLTFIISGSILVFYYDANFSHNGITFLVIAVSATVLYEIILKNKQSEMQINKLQLLYYYGPFSSILLGISLPILEDPLGTFGRNWTTIQLVLMFVSCLLTFFNNVITNSITGRTTLLNYTILIQIKLMFILTASWFLFEEILNKNQMIGLAINIFGCLAYNFIKSKNKIYEQYKQII